MTESWIPFIPLIAIIIIIVSFIIQGLVSQHRVNKLSLYQKLILGYACCGIDQDGKLIITQKR